MQLSRTRFNQYVRALRITSTLAQNEFWEMWQKIDFSNPSKARDILISIVFGVVEKYGDAAAMVASEYYDELRQLSGVASSYSSVLAENVAVEQVESSVRYAARHLFKDNPEQARLYLNGALDKFVKQPARDTIALNAKRDPAKPTFARVPTGAKTCAWCMVLASRGFVYRNANAAGESAQYHKHCDCQAVPSFGKDSYLKGYDPKSIKDMYDKAVKYDQYGHVAVNETLKNMRKMHPERVSDGKGAIRSQKGAKPLKKELLSAKKLVQKGYDLEFLPVSHISGQKNPDVKIDGKVWEIKAPKGSGKTTIDNNLKKAKKQSSRVVLDNAFSGLTDDQAMEQLNRSLRNRTTIEEVLFIEKSGVIWRIKNE